MNDTIAHAAVVRPPWHFWVIAVLSLLWNAFGCFDYSMTMTRNAAYLAQFPPEMIDYLDTFPTWATTVWALGVWGALAGSILLLGRSRLAVTAFAVSLAGLAASTAYQASTDVPAVMETTGMIVMNLVIWALAIFFLWYAWKQRAKGVLK